MGWRCLLLFLTAHNAFIRCSRMYGERMDTGFEFVDEDLVDHAMASNPALPPERVSYNIDPEMRFSTRPMSGVALMLTGFVNYLQSQRSEGFSQFPGNGFLDTHLEPALARTCRPR